MTVQVENFGDLSLVEELKWAEHIGQTNKVRKTKCLKSAFDDYYGQITVWRPRSLQNTKIKTPFEKKMTPGHTVINRSILNTREHIQLLAIPKRLIYDPHTLKPIKRKLRSCSPRVAELSVPKKDRVYCTWAQYHNKLAPSKIDRLYELLTLEIPNRSKAGTRNCLKKTVRKKKTNSETKDHIVEYTVHQIATCCAVKLSNWICCQIEQNLNKEQKQIAYHIKLNLEKTSVISSDCGNFCEPIKLCAIIVYRILHQLNCYEDYSSDHMLSDSRSNDDSDNHNGNNSGNSKYDGDVFDENHKVFNKNRIPLKKSTYSTRTRPDEPTSTGVQKALSVEEMTEDTTPINEIELNQDNNNDNINEDNGEDNIVEKNVSNTKVSSKSIIDDDAIPDDNKEEQRFVPKEEDIKQKKIHVQKDTSPIYLQTTNINYSLVPVGALELKKSITTITSTSTSKICNFSDELNCLCKEIYCKLDIISSDLHNFDTMPHAPNTVCCASVKAWARFIREVAETSRTWCCWITKTVNRMRKIARILKADTTYCCGCQKRKLTCNNYRKWLNFFEKLDYDIGRWRTYNSHVQDISEEIVSHYKNKRVECCELCKEEYYDVKQLSVRHVCRQLMDALNASKYWREWLGEMVDECESLTKLITKDEGSLIKLSMSGYEMRKHKCNFQAFQGSIYSISEINV